MTHYKLVGNDDKSGFEEGTQNTVLRLLLEPRAIDGAWRHQFNQLVREAGRDWNIMALPDNIAVFHPVDQWQRAVDIVKVLVERTNERLAAAEQNLAAMQEEYRLKHEQDAAAAKKALGDLKF